ncbi:MAG TPA: MBOAT family O-acyltransferase [Cyclobacteriaceae bacterium]|nr:MBOAT family O-acyltransferase [Cyclobacteriaceae bacterium]
MFDIDIHKLIEQFAFHKGEPMLFNSGLFLFLFAGFYGIYILLSNTERPRLVFVTLFSIYFYYKSSGFYFLLLLGSIVVDFFLAQWIGNSRKHWKRLSLLVVSLMANLGMLAYYKYGNLIHEMFSTMAEVTFEPLDIFLPVGISFFTFQSLSYTIDVYRKKLKPLQNFLDYAFFVSFFPQLVAGPIVRASDFLPQIHQPVLVTKEMFGRAIFLICSGLFKKAVISDYISLNFVDRIFDAPALYSGLENLFGVYGYALQIYCDFSGYSDMAIGIALLLGFRFNENFNSPYQSKNITEFWRRWHISLSTWLKDYLYISLGGNRMGKVRTYINLMLTMLLGGLWHGASLKFMLWGGLHGLALAVHKAVSKVKFIKTNSPALKELGNIGCVLLTFHFVCFCWIFFRAASMEVSWEIISQITQNFKAEVFFDFLMGYKGVVLLMIIGYILHAIPQKVELKVQEQITKAPVPAKAALITLVILIIVQVKSAGIQPFIYFQF